MKNVNRINRGTALTKGELRDLYLTDILRGGAVPEPTNKGEWSIINRLSEGNSKLVASSSKERFLIWNIPAIKTCPFATKLCMSNCYARKSERMYPNVLPSRELNYKLSQMDNWSDFMVNNIQYMLNKPSYKKADTVYFRFHESGDIYSQDYLLKMFDVMRRIQKLYGDKVVFTFYTKSLPYLTGLKVPSNCNVLFSIWEDTLQAYINIARARKVSTFEAVEPNKITHTDLQCIGDCSICKECYTSGRKSIKVAIH